MDEPDDIISGGRAPRAPFGFSHWTRFPRILRWVAGGLAAVLISIAVLTLTTSRHTKHSMGPGRSRSAQTGPGSGQPVTIGCLSAYGANRVVVSVGLVPHSQRVRLIHLSVHVIGMRLLSSKVVRDCTSAGRSVSVRGAVLTPQDPKALSLTFAVKNCGILPHLPSVEIILRNAEADHSRISRLSVKLGATPPNVIIACELAMSRLARAAGPTRS
jgi:hypothetical protein